MNAFLIFVRVPLILSAVGFVVVALVWTIVTLVRGRHGLLRDAVGKSAPEALGAAAIVAIVVFAVPPNPGVQTTVNLVPLVGLADNLFSFDWDIAVVNAIGNVVLFLPIGAAVVWRFHAGIRRAVGIGVLLSVSVESLQFVLKNGRSVDIDDVLLNGLGTFSGAAAMSLILRAFHRPEASAASTTPS